MNSIKRLKAPTHQTDNRERAVTASSFVHRCQAKTKAPFTRLRQQACPCRACAETNPSTETQTTVMMKQHFLETLSPIKLLLTENMSDKKLQMALVKRQSRNNKEEPREMCVTMETTATGSGGLSLSVSVCWSAYLNSQSE